MQLKVTYWVKLVIFVTLLFGVVSTETAHAEGVAETEITSPESAQGQEFVKAWRVFSKNGRNILKLDPVALERFLKLKAHPKFSAFGLTDDIAASIRGIDGVSYTQMLDDLEKAMDILPVDKTSNFIQIVQTGTKRGLINNNPVNGIYDRRHSWLTLKTIQENADFFKSAKSIEFEAILETVDGIPQSIPDIKLVIDNNGVDRVLIGEVYAGKAGAKSNLATQSITYFQEISDLTDLRFFRRLNISDKPTAKQAVIDAWKTGGVLDSDKSFQLFSKFDTEVTQTFELSAKSQLEAYLLNNDEWFDLIFNSAFK